MTQVQANVQLMVDFHGMRNETGPLQNLTSATRKGFLRACALALHGQRFAEFTGMTQSSEFNPILTLDATGHPSFEEVRDNIVAAVGYYNSLEFPLTFRTDTLEMPAAPPYSCVRWVWLNGQWVAIYNYDLMATDPALVPRSGQLTARFHVALTYPRSSWDVQS